MEVFFFRFRLPETGTEATLLAAFAVLKGKVMDMREDG
jgi:hypothetical protein